MSGLRSVQGLMFQEFTHPRDIEQLVSTLVSVPKRLRSVELGKEWYADLPYCVVGAVFSINIRSQQWLRIVETFDAKSGWQALLSSEERRSVTDLIALLNRRGDSENAREFFDSAHRTSAKGGILKSEAVRLFASALVEEGIRVRADLSAQKILSAFRRVKTIPGQKSGISFVFFLMLAGLADFVKPDRRIQRFVAESLGRKISANAAAEIVRQSAYAMNMRPADLDLTIWEWLTKRSELRVVARA